MHCELSPGALGLSATWGAEVMWWRADWKQACRRDHTLPLGDLSSAATDRAEPHPAVPQAWEEQPLPTEPESCAHTPWAKGGQREEGAAKYSNVIPGKSTSHSLVGEDYIHS